MSYVSWTIDTEMEYTEDGDEVSGAEYVLIEKVFVEKELRGQGVGRKMMVEELAQIKAEHGGKTIRLAALPFDDGMDMSDLVAFYESLGFDVEDASGNAVIMYM